MGQTDKHTHSSVYRVAPATKMKIMQPETIKLKTIVLTPLKFDIISSILTNFCTQERILSCLGLGCIRE